MESSCPWSALSSLRKSLLFRMLRLFLISWYNAVTLALSAALPYSPYDCMLECIDFILDCMFSKITPFLF